MSMTLGQLMPVMTMAGLGYTQREELENVVGTGLDIVRVAAVQYELSSIRTAVATAYVMDEIPRGFESRFSDFVRDNMHADGRDPAYDFWSNPYTVIEDDEEFIIYSFGPDGEDDTDDDIWVTLPK